MTILSVYQQALQSVGIGAVDSFSIHQLLQFHNQMKDVNTLLTHLDQTMKNVESFNRDFSRLKKGEPVAYILGFTSFLGMTLKVNATVLIPRQETEELVLKAIQLFPSANKINVVDVGTGSGAIALAIKSRMPHWHVMGTDISQPALKIAKTNANRLHLDISLRHGDGLGFLETKLNHTIHLIISNPPYVANEQQLDPFVKQYEPRLALIANPNTQFYEQYLKEGKRLLAPKGMFAFEIDPSLVSPLQNMTKTMYPSATWTFLKDINGKTRFALLYT